MKSSGLMQLTVQVGTCTIPHLPYLEYSLTVRINKDISASTTFKNNEGSTIDFATKLFLRIDKALLQQTPNCSVIVSGINQKSSRCEVGRGEAKTWGEGIQSIRMKVGEREDCWLQARLQFCASVCEAKQTKTNNNRMSNFKSQLSQKQSSSEQKQSHPSKTSTSFEYLTPKQKSADPHHQPSIIKQSKSEKILPQLQNSTATTKESNKNQQHQLKEAQSHLLLTMQMKIDSLQQKIVALQQQLKTVCHKMKQSEELLEDQHSRRVKLQETKEQLSQLLILEEQKNNICVKHIEKLNKLIQSLSVPQDEFELIEEKDEIIMLNQELEKQIINKNITINQMRNQIETLHNKIISFENIKIKHITQTQQEPKIVVSSGKTIANNEKPKDKRSSQRNVPQRKSEELSVSNKPKDTKKLKQKQSKQIKNDILASNKKPAIPKNPREVKSPTMTPKSEASLSIRQPKAKVGKGLKVQQKATMQTQKQSHIEQSIRSFGSMDQSPNLMINSRAKEMQIWKGKQ